MRAAAVAAMWLATAACVGAPDLGEAPFLCHHGTPECPGGYVCSDGFCLRPGFMRAAVSPDAGEGEAESEGEPDAGSGGESEAEAEAESEAESESESEGESEAEGDGSCVDNPDVCHVQDGFVCCRAMNRCCDLRDADCARCAWGRM